MTTEIINTLDNNKKTALAYFDALIAGGLPDEMLTDDMTAWTTLGGTTDKNSYQAMCKLLRKMAPNELAFTVNAITAEGNRVIVEAQSKAILLNGEDYQNTYVFVFHINDGRIAHVAEHFNALVVKEKLVPLMAQIN